MGGYMVEKIFDGALSPAEVKEKLDTLKIEDEHESGHGRGLSSVYFDFVSNPRVKTQQEVRDAYENMGKCSGVVLRVTRSELAWDKRGPLKAHEQAVAAAHQAAANLYPEIVKRLRAQTSKTRGCKTCESAIAVKYLKVTERRYPASGRTIACPVCEQPDFVLTQGDFAKRDTLAKAVDKVTAALRAAEADLAAQHAVPIWFAYGYARD